MKRILNLFENIAFSREMVREQMGECLDDSISGTTATLSG